MRAARAAAEARGGADPASAVVGMSRKRKYSVLLLCCIPYVMAQLDATIVNIALPTISRDLHASMQSLQWIVSAYLLVLSSLLILSGTIADRFGRRRNLIVGLAVFVVGSALCGLAQNTGQLVTFRCLQAVGGALITPATLATITTMFPDHGDRAKAMGWWAGAGGIGVAIGPLLGGVIVEYLSWRWVFYINVVPGIAAIVLCWIFLPESRSPHPRRFDIAGVAMLMVMVFALAHSIIEGPTYGWGSPVILGGFGVAIAVGVAFVLTARHRPDPVVPLPLFKDLPFVRSVSSAVSGAAALAGLLFTITLFVQEVRHLSPIATGLVCMPMVVLTSTGAVMAGRLVAKGHARALLLCSGSGMVIAAVLLWFAASASPWWFIVPLVVFGASFGLLNNPVNVTALSELPDSLAGMASSVVSTSRQFGRVLGIALVGTLMGGSLSAALGSDAVHAVRPVWILVAVCGAVVLLLNLRATDPVRHPTQLALGHADPH